MDEKKLDQLLSDALDRKEQIPGLRLPKWAQHALTAAGCLLCLAVGFLLGYGRDPAPVVGESTVPPVTAPQLPDNCQILYQDDELTCYRYLQGLPVSIEASESFSGSTADYRLGSWDEAFSRIGTDRYNTWLRIELTQQGRDHHIGTDALQLLADGTPLVPDIYGTYLGTAPYYLADGTLAGWFVKGWVPRTATLTFSWGTREDETVIVFEAAVTPLINSETNKYYSTAELVDAVLHDVTPWQENHGKLPDQLYTYSSLEMLHKRESACIPLLIEYVKEDTELRQRAIDLLTSEPFVKLMSDADRDLFNTLAFSYFTVQVYDRALETYVAPSMLGHLQGTPYFLDGDIRWRLDQTVPEALRGMTDFNYFARIALTPYYKTQYKESWKIYFVYAVVTPEGSEIAEPSYTLDFRKYYDNQGNVAGWFVYGHVAEPQDLELELWDAAASDYLTGYTLSVAPITEGPILPPVDVPVVTDAYIPSEEEVSP